MEPNTQNTDSFNVADPTEAELGTNDVSGSNPPDVTTMNIDDIEALENSTRKEQGLPPLDDTMQVPVDSSPDLWKPIRERIESGVSFDGMGFLSDLYGIGQAAVYGLGSGLQETARTMVELSQSPLSPTGQAKTFGNLIGKHLFGLPGNDNDQLVKQFEEAIPNVAEMLGVPKPDTPIENIVSTLSPLVAATVTGEAALEGVGVTSRLGMLKLPGLLGRLTEGAPKTLTTMLAGAASVGTTLDPKTHNFADMLKEFSKRTDLVYNVNGMRVDLGHLAKLWYDNVPGVSLLSKDEGDHPLTMRLKNTLDAAYGEVVAPSVFLALRSLKLGGEAVKGSIERSVFSRLASESATNDEFLTKLANDASSEDALNILYPKDSNVVPIIKNQTEFNQVVSHNLADDIAGGQIPFVKGDTYDTDLKTINYTLKQMAEFKGVRPSEIFSGADTETIAREMQAAGIPEYTPEYQNLPPIDEGFQPSETLTGQVSITDTEAATKQPPRPETPNEPLPSWKDADPVEHLKNVTSLSPRDLLNRITAAQVKNEAEDAARLADLRAYTKRFHTMIDRVGGAVERKSFDSDGYYESLVKAASSDDPNELSRALDGYGAFVNAPEGNPSPLLTPRQLEAWNNTPYSVIGDVVDSVKRLVTTNAARKEEAVKFLGERLGGSSGKFDTDFDKIARELLSETAQSTSEVQLAARRMLINNDMLSQYLKPDLGAAIKLAAREPNNESAKRTILALAKRGAQLKEANKNLKSAAGSLLQSAQIDPETDEFLKTMYGAQKLEAEFSTVGDTTVDDLDAVFDTNRSLSTGETATINAIMKRWNTVTDSERDNLIHSAYHVGQHPVWSGLTNTSRFADELFGNLLMSSMLYHPATWGRVLSGATTGAVWDSASQLIGSATLRTFRDKAPKLYEALFNGAPVDPATHDVLMIGAAYRAASLPYSLMVAGKSFIRPVYQDLHSIGTTMYKSSPVLGPEMFERSFGKDVATRIFGKGNTLAGTALRTAGAGLGFPMHTLGSFETMINHNALSSRIVEILAQRAVGKGLRGRNAAQFVFDNLPDVMEDAIVAKSVGRGDVSLRNTVGLTTDELRQAADRAGELADYTSLRSRGDEAGSELATSKLRDTMPFRIVDLISSAAGNLPVLPRTSRATMIPFGNVTANMFQRAVSPIQAYLTGGARLTGLQGGPSRYIDEVLGGLHGPHAQSILVGHTLLTTAITGLGALSMFKMLHDGKQPNYTPLGARDSDTEAMNERGVRFGESPLPDGSTITTSGMQPMSGYYNSGAYGAWILSKYGMPDDQSTATEEGLHVAKLISQMVPLEPLFQGMREVFGGVGANENAFGGFMSGIASGWGNALERPLRIPDLLPGQQVPGRSVAIRDAGVARSFLTAMGGTSGSANINRINAYNSVGELVPDKYDPNNEINQYMDSFGFPTIRPYDTSKLGQFMGELESHGMSLPTVPRKVTLPMPVGNSIENVPINLQHFYNPKTHEHLWDVYNRLVREQRVTQNINGTLKDLTIRQNLERIAAGADPNDASHVYRNKRSRVRAFGDAANEMVVKLHEYYDDASDALRLYVNEHGSEFINLNDESQTLEDYAKMMYDAKRTQPINEPSGASIDSGSIDEPAPVEAESPIDNVGNP